MSITFGIFLWILITHLIADFWVQTEYQANNKWHEDSALFEHCVTYGLCFAPFAFYYFIPFVAIVFIVMTIYLHMLTDRQTSKLTHKYFGAKEYRKGFQVVGIDQTIHMICLYGLVELLSINLVNIR